MFFITKNAGDFPILGKNLRVKSKDCPLKLSASLEEIQKLMPYKFRLIDSEGNLYYEGFYDGFEGSPEQVWKPLIWAKNYTDCQELHVLENGEWFELIPEIPA